MNIDNLTPASNNTDTNNNPLPNPGAAVPPTPPIAPATPNVGTPSPTPAPSGPMTPPPMPSMPTQGPSPIPNPGAAVPPTPPIAPATPNIGTPSPTPAPMQEPAPPVGAPGLSGGVPNTPPAPSGPVASVTPQPPINLQPEGMIPPEEIAPPTPPEPLMGSTLTANSTLVNTPQAPDAKPTVNPVNEITFQPPTFNNEPSPNTPPTPAPGASPQIPGVPTPPPIDDGKKKKGSKEKGNKKISTPLLIVLIVVLVAGIGYGVYYILNSSSTPGSNGTPIVLAKLTTWEKGENLPTNINDYATITGTDPNNCTFDVSQIDINTVSNQKYKISCPGLSTPVEGAIAIKDTKGPNIETKEVTVTPNSTVEISDFITSCKDASLTNTNGECDVKLQDGEKPLSELTANAGTYEVKITVSDDYDNTTEATVTLKVDNNAPSEVLSCSSSVDTSTRENASIITTYNYGLTSSGELSSTQKIVTYTFTEEEAYKTAQDILNSENELDGVKGTAKYDEENLKITLTSDIATSDLQTEFNVTTPITTTFDGLLEFHEGDKGDTCMVS